MHGEFVYEWMLLFSTKIKHNSYLKDKVNCAIIPPTFLVFPLPLPCRLLSLCHLNESHRCPWSCFYIIWFQTSEPLLTPLILSVIQIERNGISVWLSLKYLYSKEGDWQKVCSVLWVFCECVRPSSLPAGSDLTSPCGCDFHTRISS